MKWGCYMAYLHENKEQFYEAINLTAYQTNVMAQAIEKDYYVTMILRLLSETMPFIVFKGGTALSKCHNVIKRFSEDIDIAVDTSVSQGQKRKLKYAIVEIAEKLGMRIANLDNTRSRRDYNCYVIEYDTVLPLLNKTLQPAVLMETSFTAISFPTVTLPVSNYIAKMLENEAPEVIEEYQLDDFEMKVQGIDRTLADKVFAICDYYLEDKVKKHSRHLYDIYKLLPLVSQDESFKVLVQEVRELRKQYNICPSAQDGVNVPELLKRIIRDEVYKTDYLNVTESLLEESVTYDRAIKALIEISNSGILKNDTKGVRVMYSVDTKEAQLLLVYSDVFSGPIPELKDEISKLNMHKAISIICELIVVRDAKLDSVPVIGGELEIPLEMVLKKNCVILIRNHQMKC